MSSRTRSLGFALRGALFALLSCAVTWPLVLEPHQLLGRITPPGQPIDVGDGIAFLGYVVRAANALSSGGSLLEVAAANANFTAPPAYLFPAALLTSLLGSPLLAHNVMLLTYTFLAFVCMFAFVHQLTANALAASYACVFYGSCNYLVHHASGGHANQAQIFLFPLLFLATERLLARADGWRGAGLGAVLALCAVSSAQYAVFVALLLPLYVVVRAPAQLRERATLRALSIAAATALVLASYSLAIKVEGGTVERSLVEIQHYVVHSLFEYLDPDAYSHLGLLPLLLAAFAVGSGAAPRRSVLALGAVFAVSVALSLGPMSPFHPYRWLYETLPGFGVMRTPIRFSAPALAAGFALAGIGLASLTARLQPHPRARLAVLTAIFAASFIATPLLADRYYHRALEPGSIWTVEVRSQPYFQQLTRRAHP